MGTSQWERFLKTFPRNVKNSSTGNQLGHSTVVMENKFLHVDSILLTTFYQAGLKLIHITFKFNVSLVNLE